MRAIFFISIASIILLALVFEVWMFLDVLKNKKLTDTEKILWVLGMFLLHPIIAIVYFFVARSSLDAKR